MNAKHLATIIGLSTLLSAACGRSTSQSRTNDTVVNGPAAVQITNNNVQDVDVYLDRGGEHLRLGMVGTGQTQTFNIPSTMLHAGNDLRVAVHPIGGGGDYATETMLLHGGETVELVVAPVINQSRMQVQTGG